MITNYNVRTLLDERHNGRRHVAQVEGPEHRLHFLHRLRDAESGVRVRRSDEHGLRKPAEVAGHFGGVGRATRGGALPGWL